MIFKLNQNRVSRTYMGGSRIDKFTGEKFETKNNIPYPEDWLASVTTALNPDGAVEGLGTTQNNISIKDIVTDDVLPILVKLLDSDERLVVQVHPTVEYAKQNLNSNFGKTECWYFIDCTDDACVYLGFKEGITKDKWRTAIEMQDTALILSFLHKIPVKQGDFVFVDGGVPHAIGGGCFMIELQEPSDLMVVAEKYTVSGRKITDFRIDMGLGMDKALDMYDYTGYSRDEILQKYISHPNPLENAAVKIVDNTMTDKFTMHCLFQNTYIETKRKYSVAVVTSGCGTICGHTAKAGDRFFICEEPKIETTGNNSFKVILCE